MLKKTLFALSVSAIAVASPAAADVKPPKKAAQSTGQISLSYSPILVVDMNGDTVAEVLGRTEEMFKVKTDKYEIELPAASFREGDGGNYVMALTQAELNTMYEDSLRSVEDSVSVGKDVFDADLQPAGTIEVVGPETVTIRLTNGTVVRVPSNGITPRAEGAILGYRNADLEPLGVEMTPEEVAEQARLIAEQAAAAADAEAQVEAETGDATAEVGVSVETNL